MYSNVRQGYKLPGTKIELDAPGEKMARKRKTGLSSSEWRSIFARVARECSEEAKRKGVRFQDCVRQKLIAYK